MRLLFIGDIVGAPGVQIVRRAVPLMRSRDQIDLVVANAENAAGGSGLYPNTLRQLRAAGVDAVTMGDHLYKKMDLVSALVGDEKLFSASDYRDKVVATFLIRAPQPAVAAVPAALPCFAPVVEIVPPLFPWEVPGGWWQRPPSGMWWHLPH